MLLMKPFSHTLLKRLCKPTYKNLFLYTATLIAAKGVIPAPFFNGINSSGNPGVVPAKAGNQFLNTGFPRVKHGAGWVKPGMTKCIKLMSSCIILVFLLSIFLPSLSFSTPEYARQTGFECQTCHIDTTGGKLTKAGEDFREDLRITGLYRPLNTVQRVVRLIIRYLHLLTAIAWFGTILSEFRVKT